MSEVSQMTHDDLHHALVRRLMAEVKPTRRLWSVGVRLGLWMVLEVGVLAWVATPTSDDFMQKLKRPIYGIEILFFAAAAVISVEYWPKGLDGPICTERAPFRNVAIMADNDRMYHRIGQFGDPGAKVPLLTDAAEILPAGDGAWAIVENRETHATYPSKAIRLSLVWKADVETEGHIEPLALDRVMSIFIADLIRRSIDFCIPAIPLSHSDWMALLDRIYCAPPGAQIAKNTMPG